MNKILYLIIFILFISLIFNIISCKRYNNKYEKYFSYMNYPGYGLGSVSSIITPYMFLLKNNAEWKKRMAMADTEDCDYDYDCKNKTML